MTPDDYRRAGALFDRLRELPDSDQAAALDAACGGDSELREQVLRLLAADRDASSFMEQGAIEDAARLLSANGALPAPGTVVGNYKLGSRIGAGGMGIVYEAYDLRLDRKVAIKLLQPPFGADGKERIKRFQREARAASLLTHPNIVSIFDADFDKGHYYIAMEYVEGATFRQLIASEPPNIDPTTVLDLIAQTASALHAAHEAGMVHRDIKPENIMVRSDGFVKVLDFGLAKLKEPSGRPADAASDLRTRPGLLAGTIQYLSPEQVAGRPVDARSDLFSLGVVAYELATGVRPFDGPTDGAMFNAILNHTPVPPSSIRRALGNDFDRLVLQALEKDRELRFQTASDLCSSCRRLGRDSFAAKALPASQPVSKIRSRGWIPWTLCGLLAVYTTYLTYVQFQRLPAQALQLTRLTWDSGVSAWPAISPDGNLVSYASDREGHNNLDLYVQQIPGGRPVCITQTEEDESEPSFSPDGASIAFSSSKSGGSIYIIPALGGEPRLLVRGGHSPRYSPDGNWIAYWSGVVTAGNLTAPGSASVFVIRSSGGIPRQIHPEFTVARWPVWSPDGHWLMFQGVAPGPGDPVERLDYWVTALESGNVRSSGLRQRIRKARLEGLFFDLTCWTRDGIFFNPPLSEDLSWGGMQKNIYRCALTPDGRTAGDLTRITAGTTTDVSAAVARNGRMVFASGGQRINVWGLPIDGNRGQVRGAPYRITDGLVPTIHPRLSPDGRKLLFDSQRNGTQEMWMRDLTTGKEVVAATGRIGGAKVRGGTYGGYFLRSSGRIRFGSSDGNFLLDLSTGESRKLDVGGAIGDFNRTEATALVRHDTPNAAWDAVDLKQGKRTRLLRADQGSLYLAQFSPDDRWVIFLLRPNPVSSRIYVARWQGFQEIPQADWRPITDGKSQVNKPLFSPDGKLIYFTKDLDGSRSIQAVRFNPESGLLVGTPFLVYDFRGARLSMASVNLSDLGMDVAADKMIMVLAESNWNVFMAEMNSHQ